VPGNSRYLAKEDVVPMWGHYQFPAISSAADMGLLWGYFAPTDPIPPRAFGGPRATSCRSSVFAKGELPPPVSRAGQRGLAPRASCARTYLLFCHFLGEAGRTGSAIRLLVI
jgi:hypothetical protein